MATQIPFTTHDLFHSIGLRWSTEGMSNFVSGGLYAGDVPEKTKRPYAVISSIGEDPFLHTSKSRIGRFTFEVDVAADDWEALKPIVKAVLACLCGAPLQLPDSVNGSYLASVLPGPIRYLEEVKYWRSIMEFSGIVRQDKLVNS